ncbi:class I SAM-dependent methyltransferase [Haliovirga abyssi]|uniref:SAM-dependent methyltransferase n=1 Tax=Haliovirga abyssi TaxID=2996794 RepID=A0AAU9DPP3_9FUSO|nr:class I SAM-dependent methyltransferase [Haliovirga abyssi]BDU50413.1 SAM-dependent methyltransferase [Haliovirga abyssi]
MNKLQQYYEKYSESNRLEKDKTSKIEFLTNIEYLNKYIKKGKLLDVGAGSGIYSSYYDEKEIEVTAIDVVQSHVNFMKEKFVDKNINVKLGSALDLSEFKENSFEFVLCLGPIYHLRDKEERIKCIKECNKVLKKGGILAVAYINKMHIIPRYLGIHNEIIEKDVIEYFLKTGNFSSEVKDEFLKVSHFDYPEEIENLIVNEGNEVIEHIASDSIWKLTKNEINNLTELEFELLLKYHLETCNQKNSLGLSNHGLIISKKIS